MKSLLTSRRTAVIVEIALICVAVSSARQLQAADTTAFGSAFPKGHYTALNALPDWGGVWTLNFSLPPAGTAPPAPSLKGQYLKEFQSWQSQVKATHGDVPQEGSHCRPPGMPMLMMIPQYPIEFLFNPGRVTIHHEAWMQWRTIYTDGRGHPADLDPTFNGHSTGRWENGTLMVDTVGINDTLWMGMGVKHSQQLHILERIHLAANDPNTLIDEMTLEDPAALEKPWSMQLTYHRSRGEDLIEFICEENDRNPVDATGHTEFK